LVYILHTEKAITRKAPKITFLRTKYFEKDPLKAAIDLQARPCPGESIGACWGEKPPISG